MGSSYVNVNEGYVLAKLFENNFFAKTRRAALLIIFFLTFAVPASPDLKASAHTGKGIHGLGEVLEAGTKPGSNIESNTDRPVSLYLAYHLDCKYCGANKKDISTVELKSQFEYRGIDYDFVWHSGPSDFKFLSR